MVNDNQKVCGLTEMFGFTVDVETFQTQHLINSLLINYKTFPNG